MLNAPLASLPDAATAAPAVDTAPHVLVACGPHVFDLTQVPAELQTAALMAVQKTIAAPAFLAFVHKGWPQLEAAARQMLTACGAG
jgi:hypothetical protein